MSSPTKTTVSVPSVMGKRAKRLRDKNGNSHSLQRLLIRGLGMVLDAELPRKPRAARAPAPRKVKSVRPTKRAPRKHSTRST